jgi:hypothetical protein
MSDIKTVHFLTTYPPYNAGDVAGFPPGKADELVRAGAAADTDASGHPVEHAVTGPGERAVGLPQRELSVRAGDRERAASTNQPTALPVAAVPSSSVPVTPVLDDQASGSESASTTAKGKAKSK